MRRSGPVDQHVGSLLRGERVSRGMTQMQVAEKMGITYQQLHKIEKGINRLAIPRFLAWCDSVQVDPVYIMRLIKGSSIPREDSRQVLELARSFSSIRDERGRNIASMLVSFLASEGRATPVVE